MSKVTLYPHEEKWRKTGLLDGVDGVEKALLAQNLEMVAKYVLSQDGVEPERDLNEKAGFIFPVVVRLFMENKLRFLDTPRLAKQFYNHFSGWFTRLYKVYRMDDAEFVDKYIHDFNLTG